MTNKDSGDQVIKERIAFVCSIVKTRVSECDFRLSIAGNRFQLKLLNLIEPEIVINISPYFLDQGQSAQGLSGTEFFLNTRVPGPRFLKIMGKVIGDSIQFISFMVLKEPMIVVFYNLDYTNVILALLSRLLGHKAFVVAADYVSPPTNIYETFLIWAYRYMSGVITLRKNCNLSNKQLNISAILDIFPEETQFPSDSANILYSGSLGKTTGLHLVLSAAVARPKLTFYMTGRPFHLSEQRLKGLINAANADGANIVYLGTLPFPDYRKILRKASIALSLRDPSNPDHENNFPSKIAEYMYAGKVVISSIAYPELPKNTYVLVNYSRDSLVNEIDALVNSKDHMVALSQRAKFSVSNSFSPQIVRTRLLKFLYNV